MKALSFVKQMKQEWSVIYSLHNKQNVQKTRIEELEELIEDITTQQNTVDKIKQNITDMEQELQALETIRTTIIKVEDKVEGLWTALTKIKYAMKNIMQCKNNLAIAEQQYKKVFGKRCPLCLRK
jgi:DNA repair exonuclease SbcCD ATPase subunit